MGREKLEERIWLFVLKEDKNTHKKGNREIRITIPMIT